MSIHRTSQRIAHEGSTEEELCKIKQNNNLTAEHASNLYLEYASDFAYFDPRSLLAASLLWNNFLGSAAVMRYALPLSLFLCASLRSSSASPDKHPRPRK